MIQYFTDKYEIVLSILPFMLKGLEITFIISILAIFLGSILGFFLGLIRTLHYNLPKKIIGLYLHLFRGSPFLVQLYIVYFVFPSLGIAWLKFDSFTAAIVSLSFYTSSYVTEIATAAIKAVPSGQEEAARSVGMSKIQALYHVVIPQSVKLAIPPMAGVYVVIIKSTAVLSVIGLSELTRQGEIAILRMPNDTMFIYSLIAAFYFIYCYPVLRFSKWAETHFGAIGVAEKD